MPPIMRVFDFGGGTFRKTNFTFPGLKREGPFEVIRGCQFASAGKLSGFIVSQMGDLPAGQNKVVLSLAGPIADHRILEKFTNQSDVENNIPLAQMIEEGVKEAYDREITCTLLNDGEAGAWAEFSPGGALADLQTGDLGLALIVGNGVGGRLYRKTASGITPVDGAFEPGHCHIWQGFLEQIGLTPFLPSLPMLECGCGIKPLVENGGSTPICFEALARGPMMRKIVQNYIEGIRVFDPKPDDTHWSLTAPESHMRYPNFYVPRETFLENDLVKAVLDSSGVSAGLEKGKESQTIAQNFSLEAMAAALQQRSDEPIAHGILAMYGKLFAYRLAMLQTHFEKPVTFAFIGGVGYNFGRYLIPYMNQYLEKMRSPNLCRLTSWAIAPQFTVGKFPADETNLVGAAHYLAALEAAGGK